MRRLTDALVLVVARMTRVCIVSPWSYPLFNPACETPFGGAEVRLSLLAKELALTGTFDVHVVVFDHGQPKVERRDGVTLHAWTDFRHMAPPTSTVRVSSRAGQGLRKLDRRLRQLRLWFRTQRTYGFAVAGVIGRHVVSRASVALYGEIDADQYVIACNTPVAAELALFCRHRNKPLAFVAASDVDYEPAGGLAPFKTSAVGYPTHLLAYTIRHAHAHIAQTQRQADLLKRHFGRHATIVPNPIDLTRLAERRDDGSVLWVGRSAWLKQPLQFLDLARRLPTFRFVMVMMDSSETELTTRVRQVAATLPNLTLVDYVPFREIERYFASAALLVNTSLFEGFPNTFLQAGKYGLPIVTYRVDPGDMLTAWGCGRACGGDFERLVASVRELLMTPGVYAQTSARSESYVRAFHDKHVVVPLYAEVLRRLDPRRSAVATGPIGCAQRGVDTPTVSGGRPIR